MEKLAYSNWVGFAYPYFFKRSFFMNSLDYFFYGFITLFILMFFITLCFFSERISKLEDYLYISYSTEGHYIQKGE